MEGGDDGGTMQLTKVGKRQLAQHQQRFFPKTAGNGWDGEEAIQSRSCLNVTIEQTISSTRRIAIRRHCQHNERTAHKQRGKRAIRTRPGRDCLAIPGGAIQQFPRLGPKTSNNNPPSAPNFFFSRLFAHTPRKFPDPDSRESAIARSLGGPLGFAS